jgi:orotidine 5'-phosphate decarboxylase
VKAVCGPTKPFGVALQEACAQTGRLCVGIDPHAALLRQWGLDWNLAGLTEFTRICVEAFGGQVALVKPQVAFFECFGSKGFAVLEKALVDLREAGTLVVSDAKRGDIGSTNQGYADAWLRDNSPLASDALTVSPYLGVESLAPLYTAARETGRGLFVLARTSNPEGASLQDAIPTHSGKAQLHASPSVAQEIVDYLSELNNREKAQYGIGSFGVVVGATVPHPPTLENLCGPVLLPGVGAQGATKEDVDRIIGHGGTLGVPNISRALLECGPSVEDLAARLSQLNAEYFA